MHTTALVLFSGGQDSTTCLAHALERYERVETLGFDYGQRHSVEMQVRAGVRNLTDEEYKVEGQEFASFGNIQTAYYGWRRNWYVSLRYNF